MPHNHSTKRLPALPPPNTTIGLSSTGIPSVWTSPAGYNYQCRADPDNIHERIHHIAMIPVVVLIISTNLFILVHALKQKYTRRPGNWFIMSLCVADLLVGGASLETVISKSETKSLERCLVHMGLNISAIFSSIFFLLAIAVDRFLTITHALTYTKMVTLRRVMTAILLVCLLSVLVGFLPMTGWNNKEQYSGYCSFMYVHNSKYIVFLLSCSVAPIFAILVIYVCLYRLARRHLIKIQALDALNQTNLCTRTVGWSSRDWRCFRRLVAVVGCLVITWSPFLVASLWGVASARAPCWLKTAIGTHFLVLGMTNSILNPLVYTVSTRDFRNIWTSYFSKYVCSRVKISLFNR